MVCEKKKKNFYMIFYDIAIKLFGHYELSKNFILYKYTY